MHPTLDELCAQHRNEERHTRHVTALALQLFDHTRRWLGLRAGDRRRLEAAARLHDLGYASAPLDHVQAGADAILASGLRGFTPAALADVVGILLLHSGRLEGAGDDPRLAGLPDPARVQRLGALLRVADALDHSHLQDARIERIAREGPMIRLVVREGPGLGNVERAMAKSDLWQKVFPLGLVVRGRARRGYRVLPARASTAEALRRLLMVQYRALGNAARRAARSDDEEALHDLRIALRSVRRLLEAYAPALRGTGAAKVNRRLRELAKDLGPARDRDVWLSLLQKPRVGRRLRDDPRWPDFLARETRARERTQAAVRERLGSARVAKLLGRLGHLVRIELAAAAEHPGPPFAAAAARAWRQALDDTWDRRRLAVSRKVEDLHNLRIAIRKARLLAGLLAPVLPEDPAPVAAALRTVERRLGRIHDLDLARSRAARLGREAPDRLPRLLKKQRRGQVARFRREFPELLKALRRHRA